LKSVADTIGSNTNTALLTTLGSCQTIASLCKPMMLRLAGDKSFSIQLEDDVGITCQSAFTAILLVSEKHLVSM